MKGALYPYLSTTSQHSQSQGKIEQNMEDQDMGICPDLFINNDDISWNQI